MRRLATMSIALSLSLTAMPANAAPPGKVVLVSVDGGGERFFSWMLKGGRMPNLKRMLQDGTQAKFALTSFPGHAAPGQAAVWTGCWPQQNGITGNQVPLLPAAKHTLLERQSGLSSAALLAEPLWTTVAKAGKKAVVLQGTQTAPSFSYEKHGRFGQEAAGRQLIFDGAGGEVEPEWLLDSAAALQPARGWREMPASAAPLLELALQAGDTSLSGLVFDDPDDPVQGYDTLLIRPRKERAEGSVILKAGPSEAGTVSNFSLPIPVTIGKDTASVIYRLFDLAPDASTLRLYRTPIVIESSNQKGRLAEWTRHNGPFVPHGAEELYRRGKLGVSILQGGDGLAEERLMETIRLAMLSRTQRLRYAARAYEWDLLVNSVPYPDALEHLWYGLLDDRGPAFRADLSPRLWPYFEGMALMLDEFVGVARAVAGDSAVLALVSDHGFEGATRNFFPNVLLRKAGLLALDRQGRIDLKRTKAFFSPNEGSYVVLNTTERKGGIVSSQEAPRVLERAVTALRGARDPITRRRIVAGLYLTTQAEKSLGLGGPTGGDLYLDLASGYAPAADWWGKETVRPRDLLESGAPGGGPGKPSMRAVCFLAGPGVKQGAVVPPVRLIDVAPTLCRLMGIAPSAQATGRIIAEALE